MVVAMSSTTPSSCAAPRVAQRPPDAGARSRLAGGSGVNGVGIGMSAGTLSAQSGRASPSIPMYFRPQGLVQCATLFCTYRAVAARAALARVTLARMSLVLAVQMKGLGWAL
jgi:hypothetical protein